MSRAAVVLDKVWSSEAGESYGTIQIRVVVLSKKLEESDGLKDDDIDEAEDDLVEFDKSSPLASYLEKKKGRLCAVFIVNGQRHDAWDNTFLVRELGFKYLKNRTMLIVDLDGLAPQAMARLMQGSRQGFFQGDVYQALRSRIIATLKGDPDLKRLQIEAEDDIASLESGDTAVKNALDQLIDDHHAAATRAALGALEAGGAASESSPLFGNDKHQKVIVQGSDSLGTDGELPVLEKHSDAKTIRIYPDEERNLAFRAKPASRWTDLKDIKLEVDPEMPDLVVKVLKEDGGARLSLCYYEPDDFDADEYPLVAMLRIYALFNGHSEPRMLEYAIVINRKKERPKPDPPKLQEEPTFLRVASRKPVKLVLDGPSSHVKLKWDGLDSLAVGDPPAWTFAAHCLELTTYPVAGFSRPKQGRFELLLDTPASLLPGSELTFEVTANGPDSKQLQASFPAVVVEPEPKKEDQPRRVDAEAPEAAGQRRPPYDLKYITREKWDHSTCWGDSEWSDREAGCFEEPTETNPLTLVINTDAGLISGYRDHIVKDKKLDPNTVQRRLTRYNAHLAFHMFQMYEYYKRRQKDADSADDADDVHVPTDLEMRDETNRVAATLIRLMEVSS